MDRRRRFSAFVAAEREPRATILESLAFTREFLEGTGLDETARNRTAIVVEELVSNTLRHGGRDHDINLWMSLEDARHAVRLTIEDDGKGFDPTASSSFAGPDPHSGGSIGLAIVRAWAQDMDYRRIAERNVLNLSIG